MNQQNSNSTPAVTEDEIKKKLKTVCERYLEMVPEAIEIIQQYSIDSKIEPSGEALMVINECIRILDHIKKITRDIREVTIPDEISYDISPKAYVVGDKYLDFVINLISCFSSDNNFEVEINDYIKQVNNINQCIRMIHRLTRNLFYFPIPPLR